MRKIIEVISEIDKDVIVRFDDPRRVKMAYDWLLIDHEANTDRWYVVESINYGLTAKERKGKIQWVYKSKYKVLLGQLPDKTNRMQMDFMNSENRPKTTDNEFNKIVLKGFDYMKRYMEGKDEQV